MASHYTKEQLENMLVDVVNELDLSEEMVEKHGPLGTPPAELVRLVLEQKDREIYLLRHSYKKVEPQVKAYSRDECIFNYCSHPDTCEELDKCYSPRPNKTK